MSDAQAAPTVRPSSGKYTARGADARCRELAILAEIHALPADSPRRGALVQELIRVGEYHNQAKSLAYRWRSPYIDREDLVQAAMAGLCDAIDRYDPAKLRDPSSVGAKGRRGTGWTGYAWQWMRLRVSEAARAQGGIVAPKSSEIEAAGLVAKVLRKRPDATDEEIRQATGLSLARVAEARQGRRTQSWQAFGERLRRHRAALSQQVAEAQDQAQSCERQAAVRAALSRMSPATRKVVYAHLGDSAAELAQEDAEAQAAAMPRPDSARAMLRLALDNLRDELAPALYDRE